MIKLVYNQTFDYANKHNEIDIYRESRKADISCRCGIERMVKENDDDNHFNSTKVVYEAVRRYGLDRVKFVLSSTVRQMKHDGRISILNKEWAKTIPVPAEEEHGMEMYIYEVHPCLVNAMVDELRTVFPELLSTLIESYKS